MCSDLIVAISFEVTEYCSVSLGNLKCPAFDGKNAEKTVLWCWGGEEGELRLVCKK